VVLCQQVAEGPPQTRGLCEAVQHDDRGARPALFDMKRHSG
jgi:hypothetical protein